MKHQLHQMRKIEDLWIWSRMKEKRNKNVMVY